MRLAVSRKVVWESLGTPSSCEATIRPTLLALRGVVEPGGHLRGLGCWALQCHLPVVGTGWCVSCRYLNVDRAQSSVLTPIDPLGPCRCARVTLDSGTRGIHHWCGGIRDGQGIPPSSELIC